ncbi:MAG: hypothetical protein GY699_06365 [Desulfobacteraceae bacterium]|nr:hypothetical protein [Desulfobacteraceae bacterium]
MQTQTETLVRKQFFISNENVEKLERLTKEIKGSSAAKIVRDAIDAYNPNGNLENFEQDELIAVAHAKVKEAILETEKTINTVDHCIKNLSKREAK